MWNTAFVGIAGPDVRQNNLRLSRFAAYYMELRL